MQASLQLRSIGFVAESLSPKGFEFFETEVSKPRFRFFFHARAHAIRQRMLCASACNGTRVQHSSSVRALEQTLRAGFESSLPF